MKFINAREFDRDLGCSLRRQGAPVQGRGLSFFTLTGLGAMQLEKRGLPAKSRHRIIR